MKREASTRDRALLIRIAWTGASALAVQVLLLRELMTVFRGNELTFAIILSVWTIGGALGGLAGARTPFTPHAHRSSGILAWANAALILLSLPASRCAATVAGLPFGALPGSAFIGWTALAVLTPTAWLHAWSFTLYAKRYHHRRPGERRATRAYLAEAVGAGIGGLALALILLTPVRAFGLTAMIAAVWCRAALDETRIRRKTPVAIGCLLLLGSLSIPLDTQTRSLQFKGYDVLESRQSRYGRLAVTRRSGQVSYFENGLLNAVSPNPEQDESIVHIACAAHGAPRDVLVIGDSRPALLREFRKWNTRRIDCVESDPAWLDIKQAYAPVPGRPVGRARAMDGRRYLRRPGPRYDVIILALPEPDSLLINRFYTLECFRRIQARLNPGGLLALTLPGIGNYLPDHTAALIRSIERTARHVFPTVTLVPLTETHLLASDRTRTLANTPAFWTPRIEPLNAANLYVNTYTVLPDLSASRRAMLERAVEQDEARINRDFRPIAQWYAVRHRVEQTRAFASSLLHHIQHIPPPNWAWGVLVWHVLLLTGLRRRKRSPAILNAVFWTGFSELAFQMMILLACQSMFGQAYHGAALIFGFFMAGLVGGSLTSQRIGHGDRAYRALIRTQAGIVLYPLALMAALWQRDALTALPFAAGELFWSAGAAMAGFFGGLQFPLAQRSLYLQQQSVDPAVGPAYAADLAGACLGALTVGGFMLSLHGAIGVCAALAAINLMGLGVLALYSPQTVRGGGSRA